MESCITPLGDTPPEIGVPSWQRRRREAWRRRPSVVRRELYLPVVVGC